MGHLKTATPEFLRKLVLNAVQYSTSVGLSPPSGFDHCFGILNGIDENQFDHVLAVDHREFQPGGLVVASGNKLALEWMNEDGEWNDCDYDDNDSDD